VGIDYTPVLVDAARKRFPGVDIREMDARALDFPDACFRTVVFSYNGIDSVDPEGRRRILAEAARVLEPGGVFVFSSLNRRGEAFGERPWSAQPMGTGWRGLARRAKRAVVGGVNTIRNRHLFRTSNGIALAPISIHDFGMVAVFISPEVQVRDLEEAGFVVDAVLEDRDGHDVRDTLGNTRASWLYYVARKPAPAVMQRVRLAETVAA
jgi:SAM-dependent methyltransferase